MISILICSADNSLLGQARRNIEQTIGVEHEILFFDNLEKKGICEVYNYLAGRAKFSYLCFVHEDVLFQTANWGVVIGDIFSANHAIGVVGVAGSKYKSKCFSGWYSGIRSFDCANILHRYSYGDESIYLQPHSENALEEVVCLDGVFICSRKEIWQHSKFNEADLKGFHFYDIDFSLRASAICSLAVSFNINIIHITTGGDFGNNWVKTAIEYHSRSGKLLPGTKLINHSNSIEERISKTWLDFLKGYRISWKNKLRWIRMQKLHYKPALYYPIVRFLFYEPFGIGKFRKLFKKAK
jgi:glycosyl transferase family 2